jgi:hypothetical protein
MTRKSDSSKNTNNKGGVTGKKDIKFFVMMAMGLIIIAALITVIVILLGREPEVVELPPGPGIGGYTRDIGGRGFIVTEENAEEVRAELERHQQRLLPGDMHYEFSMTPNWRFPTSRTPSPNALVRNVEVNSRTVFFDVFIEGVGVVYVSPYMPLGSEHSGFALDVEMEAGTYDAVVTYFLVDDDLDILTDVSVGVTIIVEN